MMKPVSLLRLLAGNLLSVQLWLAILPMAVLGQANYATPYTFTTIAGRAGSSGSADGPNSAARFNSPDGMALDSAGNLYVADYNNSTIRKVTPAGVVTTLAGRAGSRGSTDGPNSAARFNQPSAVVVDSAGNVYVADWGNSTIRKVTPGGVVTTLAGRAGSFGTNDGTASAARFNYPEGVAVDNAGNLYVADTDNCTIRKVTPVGTDWVVTTLAGLGGADASGNPLHPGSANGTNSAARFYAPCGVAVDSASNLYVADCYNGTIRKMTPVGTNWMVTTLAGKAGSTGSADGTNSAARFINPWGVAMDSAGNLFVTDNYNHSVRKMTPVGTNWVVTTLAGRAGYQGTADGTGSIARFNSPDGVAVDNAGNVYVADTNNNTIRKGYPEMPVVIATSVPGFGFNEHQFGFSLTGPAGQLVVVETSTDLANWLPIWTNTFTGALQFSDPESGVYSNRFYRAHRN